jgi:antirestriction protein ArdC
MAYALAPRPEYGLSHEPGDIYRETLEQLEHGDVPWHRPRWLEAAVGARRVAAAPGPQDADEAFDELFAATGMDSCFGAMRTFYSVFTDMIHLADWRDCDPAEFRCDWIHELVHATGHPSRLGRDLPLVFGSNAHGVEDLIAEMGASIVCASLGIEPRLRHSGSIALWAGLLRSDPWIFEEAVRSAVEAADYLFACRDAQAAAFALIEAEEARVEQEEAARAATARRWQRQQERERWASGLVTGLRPRESLPAARHGDPTWQSPHPSSS